VPREEAERTTLHAALQRYEREITPAKRGAEQERYRIKRWLADPLANRTLASVRSSDLAGWRDVQLESGLAPATVRLALAVISHLYTIAAREWGISVVNPVQSIRQPRVDNARERHLVRDEEARLFAAIDSPGPGTAGRENTWLRPVVVFALESAARQSEILSLDWAEVDLKRRVARLRGIGGRKTKNEDRFRDVPLSPIAVATLEALARPKARRGQVFKTTASAIKQSWSRAVTRARTSYEQETLAAALAAAGFDPDEVRSEKRKLLGGPGPKPDRSTQPRKATQRIADELAADTLLVDLHFHDLRHEATSRLAEKFQLHELMKITGHKDTRMLARYYHPRAEDMARRLDPSL
jgi:integrase